MTRTLALVLPALVALAGACGCSCGRALGSGGEDAGIDGGADAAVDGGADATLDSGVDAAVDSGADAAVDGGADVSADSGADDGAEDGGEPDAPPACAEVCLDGCCQWHVCWIPSAAHCGTGGVACVACDSETANLCEGGSCVCGSTHAPCPTGTHCAGAGAAAACVCAPPWQLETFDTEYLGLSLRVDREGGAHVSYGFNGTSSGEVRYAYKAAGGTWSWTTITPGYWDGDTSLDLDAWGGVHVVFRGSDGYDRLNYGYRAASGAWGFSTITSPADAYGLSLRVDAEGGVHVAYNEPTAGPGAVKYAYKPLAGAWSTAPVGTSMRISGNRSLDVDAEDGVHLAYYVHYDGGLGYAYQPAGGSWSTTVVESGPYVGTYSALTVDALGDVHIAYYDAPDHLVKYAHKPAGGSWSVAVVDPAGNLAPSYLSLAVDANGGVHLAHNNGYLRYAYKPVAGSWDLVTVDPAQATGYFESLGLDPDRGVHIAYSGPDGGSYAYRPPCP